MSFFNGGDSTRRFLSSDFLTPPELKVEPKNHSKSMIKTKMVKAEKKDDKEPSPLNAILKNKKATKKDVHAYFETLLESFKDD
jgi:hypothetical protein